MHQPDAPRTSSKESAKGLIPQWIIWLFIALALFRGLVYAAIFPPWQSPDEHVHFEYAWLVSQHGPFAGPESISLELEQRVLKSMYEFDFWRLVGRPTPETLPSSFTDPSDRWLSLTGPQVGDERPLYYLLAGGFLRLANSRDVVTGMYIGRIVSILLYATAVGATALTTRRLFPISPFMQVVPPAFLLFLPMLGQMGAATNTDAMGVLTSTLFFASLIPVFRGRLNWQRIGTAIVTLVLALLSKKTALYLIPTALLVPPIYVWAKGVKFSRQLKAVLASSAVLLILAITVLALLPSGDANGWLGWTGSCGATRVEKNALEGKAALRVGTCADAIVSQMLQPEAVKELAGQQVSLRGWARSATGETVGQVSIADSEGLAQVQVVAEEEWLPFALTHTVSAGARWVGVRLAWGGTGKGALLFDDLALSSGDEENLLFNSAAEQPKPLLLDLLANAVTKIGAPRLLVERVLSPQSWSSEAWQEYTRGATICFHSFWGNFGWMALQLPPTWHTIIDVACLPTVVGNVVFLARRLRREWRTGYLLTLMGGFLLLALQAFLPMVRHRGSTWLPQGRYLFPGVFAIAILVAWGIHQLLPRAWEKGAALITIGLMASLDLACLFLLIIPYFYSP